MCVTGKYNDFVTFINIYIHTVNDSCGIYIELGIIPLNVVRVEYYL